ncbi:PREDICTED: UDP-GlcNAc:betaGal beta-1,3-N-acetylglucosaminyltransferase-like protein 1 isoform X2 [Priapulus caudatus]|uniref:UDP-GlcNAc:betaGal beta-1,3-N-acetylglucosaminyltransferase-like protein 1 isoform X2 n=1 Tax=Priapulus caudatus TaxID=37621 RepID=A0ABM1EEP7_PRICU|nr:PREDICTED: UDP-GlcNAc:betaGal beta-1,3-N-acetylglucosaminyltransferase-like protein 1 isoform X2 [Priapulus caudatus]
MPLEGTYDVSIVLPVCNAALWLEECLRSVCDQDFQGSLELSIYDDASQDDSRAIIERCSPALAERGIRVVISENKSGMPSGVGFAKNRAVEQSQGSHLCFLDADDVMATMRVRLQLAAASVRSRHTLLGCQVRRLPEASTQRYVQWANSTTPEQLHLQAYTSHGPTLLMPTWFCARELYDAVGGFSEAGKGTPEDLIFFLRHLELGGQLHRVDHVLLMYRYHQGGATFSVLEDTIWDVRLRALETAVLSKWKEFTIWNAGKQGRKLYRSLSVENRNKVMSFCDVDKKKIAKGVYTHEESTDLTGGIFEKNLASLNLMEGRDYIHFN